MLEVPDFMTLSRKGLIHESPFYDNLTMRTPRIWLTFLQCTIKFIKLEDDCRLIKQRGKEKRSIGTAKAKKMFRLWIYSSVRITQPIGPNIRDQLLQTGIPKPAHRSDNLLDPFKHYGMNVFPSQMVERLREKRDVKWPRKMAFDSSARDNMKSCTFHNDYGHLTDDCR